MKCVAGGRQDGHLLHSKAGTRTHLASAKVTCQTQVCACWPVSRWPLSFGRCSPGIAWPGDQDQGSDVLAKVAMPCEYPPRTTYCSSGMSKHASLVSCTALFRPLFSFPCCSRSSGFYGSSCCCYCRLRLEGTSLMTDTTVSWDAARLQPRGPSRWGSRNEKSERAELERKLKFSGVANGQPP